MRHFRNRQSVEVKKLTPYLMDLGFKLKVVYSIRDYCNSVDGLPQEQHDNGYFVKSETGHWVKVSNQGGDKLTGAGECFKPYIEPFQKKNYSVEGHAITTTRESATREGNVDFLDTRGTETGGIEIDGTGRYSIFCPREISITIDVQEINQRLSLIGSQLEERMRSLDDQDPLRSSAESARVASVIMERAITVVSNAEMQKIERIAHLFATGRLPTIEELNELMQTAELY